MWFSTLIHSSPLCSPSCSSWNTTDLNLLKIPLVNRKHETFSGPNPRVNLLLFCCTFKMLKDSGHSLHVPSFLSEYPSSLPFYELKPSDYSGSSASFSLFTFRGRSPLKSQSSSLHSASLPPLSICCILACSNPHIIPLLLYYLSSLSPRWSWENYYHALSTFCHSSHCVFTLQALR